MSTVLKILCSAVALSLMSTAVLAAEGVEGSKAAVSALLEREKAIGAQIAALESQAAGLAGRVKAIKEKGSKKSFLEDNELATLLRASIDLSRRQDALAEEEDAVNAALVKALNAGLDALREAKGGPAAVALAESWGAKLKTLIIPRKAARAFDVKVNAFDGPRELTDKADSLKDNEERIRREATALRTRLNEVKEERALKSEASDFLKEHFAFDEEDSKKGWSKTYERQAPASADTSGGRGSAASTAKGGGSAVPMSGAGGSGKATDKDGIPVSGAPGGTGAMEAGGSFGTNDGPAAGTGRGDTPSFSGPAAAAFGTVRSTVSGTMVQSIRGGRGPGDFSDPGEEAAFLEAKIRELERQAGELGARSDELRKLADELKQELKRTGR